MKKKVYFHMPSAKRVCLIGALMLSALAVDAQNATIKGTVKDSSGEPVIGATVKVQGNAKSGVVTDMDGNYTIICPPPILNWRFLMSATRHRLCLLQASRL